MSAVKHADEKIQQAEESTGYGIENPCSGHLHPMYLKDYPRAVAAHPEEKQTIGFTQSGA